MESIKSSKFKKFENSEIKDLMAIRGGSWIAKTHDPGDPNSGKDTIVCWYSNASGDEVAWATNRVDNCGKYVKV